MPPLWRNMQVISKCPDCQAVTTFESVVQGGGAIVIHRPHDVPPLGRFNRILYYMLRCAGCQRGGIVKIGDNGQPDVGVVEEFFPFSVETLAIPAAVPPDVTAEFREAERCAGYGTLRAASALFRSTLEKILKANGYANGTLQRKIDEAAADGVITEPRKQKAHEDIRVLGNDVLHDDWRQITSDEVEAAHKYTQRVLEDFYDDRETTVKLLQQKGRIQAPQATA